MVLDFTIHARGTMWTGTLYLTMLVQTTCAPMQAGVRGAEMLLLIWAHAGGCRDRGQEVVIIFVCGVVTGPRDCNSSCRTWECSDRNRQGSSSFDSTSSDCCCGRTAKISVLQSLQYLSSIDRWEMAAGLLCSLQGDALGSQPPWEPGYVAEAVEGVLCHCELSKVGEELGKLFREALETEAANVQLLQLPKVLQVLDCKRTHWVPSQAEMNQPLGLFQHWGKGLQLVFRDVQFMEVHQTTYELLIQACEPHPTQFE